MRERHAAKERGRGEPRRVADHPPAHGHDRAAAIGAGADERVVNA